MRSSIEKEAQAAAILQDERWSKVVARDKASDGTFHFAVRTTGVYCRPSCTSRRAKPENVCFYSTAEAAEADGFRPCKRCQPDGMAPADDRLKTMAHLCRWIERAQVEPTLKQLATKANMSVFHFHREFTKLVGLTPKRYATAHRRKAVRQMLMERPTVTEAIYESGYNSSGRFYADSNEVLGMTPSILRKGGIDTTIHFALGETSLGSVLVAQTERGVCAILLGDDPQELFQDLEAQFPQSHLVGADLEMEEKVATVVGMVEMTGSQADLPLDIKGTAFQQKVWDALRELPAGTTATYQEIADAVKMPRAVRAVARACAANCLAVAIPCHRVVRADGGIAGYRWGIERKAALLKREAGINLAV